MKRFALAVSALLLLAACSGGSGDSGTANYGLNDTHTTSPSDLPLTYDHSTYTADGDYVEEFATPDARCIDTDHGLYCWQQGSVPTPTTPTTAP